MNKEYKLLEIDGQTLYVCEELYNKIQKCDEQDKEIERLNNIIDEAIKCINDFVITDEYNMVDGVAIADNYMKLLKILKEGKE